MKRRLLIIALVGAITFPAAAWSASGEGLFLQKCGSCHKKGGQAAPVNPGDKAGSVWSKYFKRDRHPVDLSQSIDENDLEAVIEYLVDHAADSDKPQQAAIPK